MNIIVCIKQVPDTTEVKIDPKTGTLIREGIPVIINPDDKAGIEAAIALKEIYGGQVTVLSMGPPQAESALKEAYAMGADKVFLLTDRAFAGSDTYATSLALAYAIKSDKLKISKNEIKESQICFDLIICGRQAIDGDTAQVGPQIAEHLGLPQISYVTEIEKQDKYLIVKKVFEDEYQKIRIKMPCLLTVLKEMNQPRYMTISRIFDICQKPNIESHKINTVETISIKDIGLEPERTGLNASPTKVKKTMTKGAKSAGKVHECDARESAKLIVDKLKEKFII
ncbi:MAG: electron transfer flavoprotein subunit beta/FixA family protein [Candidatus Cloacimonetes bacterium]|nr:electron transfer flavoprotein subunit beta/FixA family protein [Candidatus Cloacimonadota bacterium]